MDWKLLKNVAPWDWPEGTGSALLSTLEDPRADEGDRILAEFHALEERE